MRRFESFRPSIKRERQPLWLLFAFYMRLGFERAEAQRSERRKRRACAAFYAAQYKEQSDAEILPPQHYTNRANFFKDLEEYCRFWIGYHFFTGLCIYGSTHIDPIAKIIYYNC